MKKLIIMSVFLLVLCHCGKKEEKPQVTTYAKELLAKRTPQPAKQPAAPAVDEKKESNLEAPVVPARVVIMPIACVNGSYAPGNYQNRHLFPALTNTLLEIYGNISAPRRNAIIDLAVEKKLISRQFFARRRKEYDLKEAVAFGNEIKADYLVIPSLYGDDTGTYKFKAQVMKPAEGENVLWETACSTQTIKLNYMATCPLYIDCAFKVAGYFLKKDQSSKPYLVKSNGTAKAKGLVAEAREKQKYLTLQDQIRGVRLLYDALKDDPNYPEAWISLSESYSILAKNLYGTSTPIEGEMALRSMVAALIALRLDPGNPGAYRAAMVSFSLNNQPHNAKRYMESYSAMEPDTPLARYVKIKSHDLSISENALKNLAPNQFFLYSQNVRPKSVKTVFSDILKAHSDSTFLYHSMSDILEPYNFFLCRPLALVHTYLAQKQFLEYYIPWLKSHSAGGDDAMKALGNLSRFNTKPSPINADKTDQVSQIMNGLRDSYMDGSASYFQLDSAPFEGLKICRQAQKEVLAKLNADPLADGNYYDSINLSERDALFLWQRELLRGPITTIYLVGTCLWVPEVPQKVIPELGKLFPLDMLVLNSGFYCLYSVTGNGPVGNYYLKKMFDVDQNNTRVKGYELDNYCKGKKQRSDLSWVTCAYYIATDPGNSQVVSTACSDLFLLDELGMSRDVLNYYRFLFPEDVWGMKHELNITKYKEKRPNTKEEISRLFHPDLTNSSDLWTAADIYRGNGYFDEALEFYKRAFEMLPGNKELARQLGWSWRLSGNPEKYIETHERCAMENSGTLTAASLYQNIGYYYYFQGDADRARPYYIKSNNIDSGQGGSILGRAYLAYAEGNRDGAMQELETEFGRYHTSTPVELTAQIMIKEKQPNEALQYIDKMLFNRQLVSHGEINALKAECLYRMGQKEKAIEVVISISNIFTNDVHMQCDIAYMYLRDGRMDDAIHYLETYLHEMKLGVWEFQPIYRTLVESYLQKDDLAGAEPYLLKCKLFYLDDENTLAILGYYALKKGDCQEARKWINMSLNVFPGLTSAIATQVLLDLKEGKVDDAIVHGEKGLKCCIFIDDTRLYSALARAYRQKGMNDKAKKLVDDIISIDGQNSYWAKKAEEQ
ncbi:MAG: hypothetical protein NT106_08005 [Candidatus Sumerlaeota bacterium]|nr:hypothetical protein [Candidatus Sumerlaeota bacterium]